MVGIAEEVASDTLVDQSPRCGKKESRTENKKRNVTIFLFISIPEVGSMRQFNRAQHG